MRSNDSKLLPKHSAHLKTSFGSPETPQNHFKKKFQKIDFRPPKLGRKIKELRETLKPIEDVFVNKWNGDRWWNGVEEIATKLLDTYNGNPDEDWWSRIITEQK